MELCSEGSLQRALVKSHDMRWKDAFQAAVGLTEGVAYLHAGSSPLGVIVHSDLKPANAMVAKGWHTKLADFGYAQLAHPSLGQLQGKGGTLCYLAPEMLRKKLSVAADVYSLGMMLWSVFTRKEPFVEKYKDDTDQIIKAILAGEMNPIPSWLPANLAQLLQKCWSTQPRKRPSSLEVLQELKDSEGLLDPMLKLEHGHGLTAEELAPDSPE